MGAARASPDAASAPIAVSRSPKPPVVRLVTRACRSAASADTAITIVASADHSPTIRRKGSGRKKGMDLRISPEMRTGRLESRPAPVSCWRRRLLALAATLAADDVEVAAVHRLAPIGNQVLRIGQVGRPLLGDHQTRRLPHRVELAVAL